jgi:hypothetical protein
MGAAGLSLCGLALTSTSPAHSDAAAPTPAVAAPAATEDAPGVTPDLPIYTRAEVAQHTTVDGEGGVWTTFGNGVYDITGFIENHPGGSDKVVLAAGGRLENYWNLYRQHYSSPAPRQHLARMCIGRVHPDDLKADKRSQRDLQDPFSLDPEVSPVLRCFVKKPVNAEPPGPLLTHSFLTPNDIFFIRNHHPVPRDLAAADYQIDETKYLVDIEIAGSADGSRPPRQVSVSLADLKSKFPRREVVASLQCGGNRREELSDVEQTAGEPPPCLHAACLHAACLHAACLHAACLHAACLHACCLHLAECRELVCDVCVCVFPVCCRVCSSSSLTPTRHSLAHRSHLHGEVGGGLLVGRAAVCWY